MSDRMTLATSTGLPFLVLAVSPLLVLLYWMWRVRLKQNLRGLMTAKPIDAQV